jgi:hypothetical protein
MTSLDALFHLLRPQSQTADLVSESCGLHVVDSSTGPEWCYFASAVLESAHTKRGSTQAQGGGQSPRGGVDSHVSITATVVVLTLYAASAQQSTEPVTQ